MRPSLTACIVLGSALGAALSTRCLSFASEKPARNVESLDDAMLRSAAESALAEGEAALKRGASAKPKAKEFCTRAADLYKLLIERKKPAKEKAAADLAKASADMAGAQAIKAAEDKVTKIEEEITLTTVRLARAQRLRQNYQEAYETLCAVLPADGKAGLEVQTEVCYVLLDWGADTDTKKFAIARGGQRGVSGLARIVGKLQQFVKGPNEELRGKFFETYLAYSKSYLTHAEKPDAAGEKAKLLQAGVSRIQTLWNVHRDEVEKSPEWYAAFDDLLKAFQNAQGQEPAGLKGLPQLER